MNFLKTMTSLVILICLFLPLTQCTDGSFLKANPEPPPGGALMEEQITEKRSSANVTKSKPRKLIVVDGLLSEDADIDLEYMFLVLAFLGPLVFSIPVKLSKIKSIVRLTIQSSFAIWLLQWFHMLVFFGEPLPAGWLLLTASIMFLVITTLEWAEISSLERHQ